MRILRNSVDPFGGLKGSHNLAIAARDGLCRRFPHNSLRGIHAAFAAGADIVDIGVRRARDGAFVIIRDERLEHCTSLFGNVSDHKLLELRQARLQRQGDRIDVGLNDDHLIALDELLGSMPGAGLLSISCGNLDDLPTLARFIAAMDMSERVILRGEIASFDDASRLLTELDEFSIFMPSISTKRTSWLPALINDLRALRLSCLHVQCSSMEELHDAAVMARAQRATIWVEEFEIPMREGRAIDVQAKEHWAELIQHGASVIQSDNIQKLARYRSRWAEAA